MILPESFTFACPTKIHVGQGALNHLPYELSCLNVRKPLVLTRKPFVDTGMLKALTGGLTGFGGFGVCGDIPDVVTDHDIGILAGIFADKGCDGILALGSGSIVDTAKRVKIAVDAGGRPPAIPLVVVPGIGGSRGLETAGWIGPGAPRMVSLAVMPVLAVIDGRSLPAVSPRETALAALAAVTLAIETALSPRRNPLTDTYAGAALGQLRRFMAAGDRAPGDEDARVALAAALAMAGCAATAVGEGMARVLGRTVAQALSVDPIAAAAVLLNPMLSSAAADAPWMAHLLWYVSGSETVAETPSSQQATAASKTLSGWLSVLLSSAAPDRDCIRDGLAKPERRAEIAAAAAATENAAATAVDYRALLDGVGPTPDAPLAPRTASPLTVSKKEGYYEFGCRVRIAAGHGMLERIPQMLSDFGAARPMVLTDKGVAAAGLAQTVIQALGDTVVVGAVEDDVPPDSDLNVVNALAARYREVGCDAIVAVGGGSVMDTAKGINIVVSENAHDLMDYSGAGNLKRPLRPLIAVPTTAGTGSEVTQVAVIADPAMHRKMLFSSYFLQPDVAVLDPRMTLTLPAAITTATAMDALTHAIEAYYCLARNPLSDAAVFTAVSLISANLMAVVETPANAHGRLALAVAATMAGIAFSNAPIGLVHTMGHSVGSVCGVPHGICMAIGLPYGLEYNLHKIDPLAGDLLLPLAGVEIFAATPVEDRAAATIAWIRKLNEALHTATGGKHPRCFKEVLRPDGQPAVPRERLADIAAVAMGDGTQVYNPEDLDAADYLMVLEAAWEGVPLDRSRIRKG